MSMSISFDSLAYFERLKQAGVPEQQARVQAEVIKEVIQTYDESSRKELATKGDIQLIKSDLRETELRLQAEIEKVRAEVQTAKYDLLKWQLGIGLALALIMAKGFGWIGF